MTVTYDIKRSVLKIYEKNDWLQVRTDATWEKKTEETWNWNTDLWNSSHYGRNGWIK